MKMAESRHSRTHFTMINVLTSFGGRLLNTILSFATKTVFIYVLGRTYLGINGVFSSILTMLSLTELGLGTAIVFHLYDPLARGDSRRIQVLLGFYKKAYRAIGIIVIILGLCLIPALPHIIKDYASISELGVNAVAVFLLYLLNSASSYLFFAYRQTVVQADQKKYILDIILAIKTLVECVLQIVVLLLFKDFVLYLMCTTICTVAANIVSGVYAKKLYPDLFEKQDEKLSKSEINNLLKDCGALFLFRLESVVLKATDNMVLSAFLGLDIVGIYTCYILVINACRGFLERFYAAVKHSMGNLFVSSTIDVKYRFFEIMNYITIILYGTASVGLVVCGNEMIAVWAGKDYVIANPFCILIGIELLLDGLIRNLEQIRNISGAFRQKWYSPLMSITVNLVLSIVLVRICGINGVVIGTICAFLTVEMIIDPYVVMTSCFNRYKPTWKYYAKNAVYVLLLVAVCCLNYLFSNNIFVGHGWASLIVHAAVVCISVPAGFVLCFYRSHECKYFLGLANRFLRRKA